MVQVQRQCNTSNCGGISKANEQQNVLSKLAVSRALDASPHEEQTISLENLRRIGDLLDSYPNMNIRLLLLYRNSLSVGFKRAKQLAFEAIRTADLRDVSVEGPKRSVAREGRPRKP